MSEVIKLTDATVVRDGATLLAGMNWKVQADERWVILGPNGAGKTTLMQLCAALLHPTSGKVTLLGERLGKADVFELRPRIGLTSAALAERIPHQETVHDAVISAAYSVLGRWNEEYQAIDHQRATELLAEVGILQLAERKYGTLSEGERKRVQIARALMTDPEILIMDEPASGLDLGGREDLVSTLDVLAEHSRAPAIILVSHHVEEIPPNFTHALLLRRGEIVVSGPVAEVITSANLSQVFEMNLGVDRVAGRYFARKLGRHRA